MLICTAPNGSLSSTTGSTSSSNRMFNLHLLSIPIISWHSGSLDLIGFLPRLVLWRIDCSFHPRLPFIQFFTFPNLKRRWVRIILLLLNLHQSLWFGAFLNEFCSGATYTKVRLLFCRV